MLSLAVLIANFWLLGIMALLLHYYSPRLGFGPLMVFLGALTVFAQSQLGIYVEPAPGMVMFLSSNVLVPNVLVAVLVLYISNGAPLARLAIGGVVMASLFTLLMLTTYRLYLTLPDSGALSGLEADDFVLVLSPRITLASIITFAADMFVIAVFYQGTRNCAARLPEWVIVGLALIASLWTDAILFRMLADFGTGDFAALMPGDVAGKTLSGLILWPLLAVYMTHIAPRLKGHVGGSNRRTFDLVIGSLARMQQKLDQTQAALAQSEAERQREADYFQQIAESISEGLWLATPHQTQAFYVNVGYERIWGRRAESLYADQHSFVKSLHPDDRDRVVAALPRQAAGDYDIEYRIVRPDGSIRWVRDRAFPIRDAADQVYRIAGICEDITQRKTLEQNQLDLELERDKVRLLRDFISEASHDLKSPLTGINLKIYQLNNQSDPDKRAVHLHELQQLSNRMAHMIDDLFTLSRLENVEAMACVELDIHQIIRDIYQMIQPQAQEKSLQVKLDFNGLPAPVLAAPDDMERALANLMQNAVTYTPPGGQVYVQTQIEEETVIVRVKDTGIGIPAADQPHIFKRFYRAASARQSNPTGSGLGLAIVQKIVERHHGRIEVDSREGEGTTFSIYLPKASA
jgi:PAS domain S-box-containing protein